VRVSVQPKRLLFLKVGKERKERVNAGRAAAAKLVDGMPDPAPVTSTGPITDSGDRCCRCLAGRHRPARTA
jgi:hypothetical protein